MDAVAAKSDAVTARKCTITDACRRFRTLTDADSRCVAFAPSACDRVKPYPSVTGPKQRLSNAVQYEKNVNDVLHQVRENRIIIPSVAQL